MSTILCVLLLTIGLSFYAQIVVEANIFSSPTLGRVLCSRIISSSTFPFKAETVIEAKISFYHLLCLPHYD